MMNMTNHDETGRVALVYRGKVHTLHQPLEGLTRHQMFKALWAQIKGKDPSDAFRDIYGVGYGGSDKVTFF